MGLLLAGKSILVQKARSEPSSMERKPLMFDFCGPRLCKAMLASGVRFLSVADRKRSVIGMNNKSSRMHSGIGITVALICLMAIAFGMQASSDIPAQQGPSPTSNLRFCYEAVQADTDHLQQQVSIPERSGLSRRCGELAQFRSFDAKLSGTVISQAQRNRSGDCLAGRRPTSRGSFHQSAFSRGGCENAVNGNMTQPTERFWF